MSIFLACSTISGEGEESDFGFYLVILFDNSCFVDIFNNDILAAIILFVVLGFVRVISYCRLGES